MLSGGMRRKAAEGLTSLGGGPPKRMTIRLSKAKPELPENFLDSSWEKLQEAVAAIHCARPVAHSREELYGMVEGLCMNKRAAVLCSRLEKVMDEHIKKSITQLVGQTQDHVAFVKLVTDTWSDHCAQMQSIRNLFLYLDRSYVIGEASLRSLWDMGLGMFRSYFERFSEVEQKVLEGFLLIIRMERNGENVNLTMCTGVVRMLVSLGLYESRFEPRFLQETSDFYRSESSRLLYEQAVPDYLAHVENRLREEAQRVNRYLDAGTRTALLRFCEKELVSQHVPFLLEKGFDMLMQGKRYQDLGRMYTLFSPVDALKEMRVAFGTYVRAQGTKIVNVSEPEEEKEMIPQLLQLKQDLDNCLKDALRGNEDFERALRDSMEAFINSRENRPAELIAKFIDVQLRSGPKGAGGEEQTEQLLERVVVLFRFLSAKDVFEAFYKKDLAKRLLVGASGSNDLERSMIAKLKTECGSNFTNRLEGMFKDVDQSKDIVQQFRRSPQFARLPHDVEVNVNILTTGFWPNYPVIKELKLDDSMTKCQSVFESFYLAKHEGRRLTWQHSLGSCIIRAAFPQSTHELQVSLYQALVLLLFSSLSGPQTLSFEDIQSLTGLDESEAKRTLTSLACGKIKVLAKEPKTGLAEPGDSFSVNNDFQSRQFRIKINSIQMKETSKENKETHEKVFQDRQYQVDAAIVRIMKARKTFSHNLLIAELIKQLRFQAKPADLKKRIESLIERDYLERDANLKDVYLYVA